MTPAVRYSLSLATGAVLAALLDVLPREAADEACLLLLVPVLLAAYVLGWRESLALSGGCACGVLATSLPRVAGWGVLLVALRVGSILAQGLGVALLCRSYERAAWRARRLEESRRARADTRTRFQLLMDSNILPMKIDDVATGVVLEANAAFGAMTGHAHDDVVGMPWERLSPPQYAPADRQAHRDALSLGHAGPYDKAFRRPDGTEVPTQVTLVLLDEAGQTVLSIARDLRPDRLLEAELRQRAEALLEEAQRKDEFLAMLGHELRNPLTPILTAADLLGREDVAQDQRDRIRRIVRDQVGLLTRLVDDLLDVARIRQGKVQLRPEPCDLVEVVEAAVEASRQTLAERRHQVFVATPDRPLWTECDPRRVNQVLVNLLGNAAKYTPPGGSVWVSLACEAAWCVIRVKDTGRGIEPGFLPRVWDLFSQEPATMDRPAGGLGLGLTLVKRLIELHDGTVEARSPGRGKGSEFVVRLPLTAMTWKKHPRPPDLPVPVHHPLRILLVDDNYAIAETTSAMLRLDGHDVSVVHDGPCAIATGRGFSPRVIFLDIGLPGMDGYEVARVLRKQHPDAVLVAVTGYGGAAARARGEDAGFDHYLVKPVETAALRQLLADVAAAPADANGSGGGRP